MSKILLTGSSGFLGSYVHNLLHHRGHQVTCLDTWWFTYPDIPSASKSQLVSSLTEEEVRRHDCIVHLAWFSSAGDKLRGLQEFSLKETKYLVDLCKETDTKLIFASTASVYGFQDLSTSCNEEMELNPICSYGKTKAAAEDYIRESLPLDQFIIFRKGTLMGRGVGGCRTRLDLVVNAFLKTALTEGMINVWQPETSRPMLHVYDAAFAYVKAVEGELGDNLFNLSHKNYIIIALAHWVANLMKEKPLVHVTFDEGDGSARSYRLSCERAVEEGISLNRGVKDVVEEFERDSDTSWLLESTAMNVAWMEKVLEMKHWLEHTKIPSEGDN